MKKDSRFERLSLLGTFTVAAVVLVLMVPGTSWCKGKILAVHKRGGFPIFPELSNYEGLSGIAEGLSNLIM